ncbi:uncharacterized protein si:dkey-87o1.2 [Cyclopterus lumpus]|uniref:uncharacterized protein si:dkey-87o1.2 n=1 Tax=Cyclopterus lumpus TaxID=8103 RepID=UPI001486F95A|nr:uncharacterized protein si:dkey-87o1.2 [Cyclopterus lumpus]
MRRGLNDTRNEQHLHSTFLASTRMKLMAFFVALSSVVMAGFIYQAMKQEYNLRNMKTRMAENTADFQRNEVAIDELKTNYQIMMKALMAVNSHTVELNEKKKDHETMAQQVSETMQTCINEKADAEHKKAVTGEEIVKLKADHSVAKENAERDIQQLKKLILDRDTAICAFADITKVEARNLCAIH